MGCFELVPGVLVTPPVPVNGLLGFLGRGFLGFFGVLGGSFGALLLAAVLRELPAISLDIELGTVLAGLFIFPVILAKGSFDKDFLAFAHELTEVLGRWVPRPARQQTW